MIELNTAERFNGYAKIQLVDMTGRTVQTDNAPITNGALQKTINVSAALTKGMYMVRIVVNDQVYHTKMVYQK